MLYDEGPVGATGVVAHEEGIPSCAIICADVKLVLLVVPTLLLKPDPVGGVPYAPE